MDIYNIRYLLFTKNRLHQAQLTITGGQLSGVVMTTAGHATRLPIEV